jgi:hypothetical protein
MVERPEFDDDDEHAGDDMPPYRAVEEIEGGVIPAALGELAFFDETYLRMQAYNLDLVDAFLNQIEQQTQSELWGVDGTPESAFFLSAISQMWIFAAYELMRTWRERVSAIVKLADNGGLELRLSTQEAKRGPIFNAGREAEIGRLKAAIADPGLVEQARVDLRRTHILFSRLEFVRIVLAKHQVRGRQKTPARAPGYGRINSWCGAIEFELGNEHVILGTINRRDIAEGLRFVTQSEPPSEEEIASFDAFMAGPDLPACPPDRPSIVI